MAYTAFYPGQVWLDTDGKRIHAHGGSVIYIDGVYYWYGENKEKSKGTRDVWHWGIRCYTSRDLYNWEDRGLIIPPEPQDPMSPLHPSAHMDRPHIIYNAETKKYVCWIKVSRPGSRCVQTVLTADHILGPYTKVRVNHKPLNMYGGDFDLAVAPDGKAYYYFTRVRSELICADLTADYTDVTGYYSTHFSCRYPPYLAEAPAHFERNGKHYLITSGTTGYLPNPSEVAVADTWHGPFTVLGNPHVGDESNTSFHSQISCIFKVEGKKDLYVACADRWLPEQMDKEYTVYEELFRNVFAPGKGTPESQKALSDYVSDAALENTSIAWGPVSMAS